MFRSVLEPKGNFRIARQKAERPERRIRFEARTFRTSRAAISADHKSSQAGVSNGEFRALLDLYLHGRPSVAHHQFALRTALSALGSSAGRGTRDRSGAAPRGHEIFDIRNNTRRTEPLELVNTIRERVDAWRAADYPGVTSVTRRLLAHWWDRGARQLPFYFCQLEAIETLIWWVEALPEFKQGIHIPGDGGPWERICSKMATGSGKTTVMSMIITWQTLNALTYPKRNKDFSRAIFIVAPGLKVKERLRVLYPGEPDNYYDAFSLCPSESLRQKGSAPDSGRGARGSRRVGRSAPPHRHA